MFDRLVSIFSRLSSNGASPSLGRTRTGDRLAAEKAARNKRSYLDAKSAFNRGDLDACMAFYAEDHQIRSQDVGRGRAHIRGFLASMQAIWGDLQIVVEHAVAEGDWVMGHCRSTAIHTTPIMGIDPTNRRIETTFWDLHRFNDDGLIAETWNVSDGLAVMQQLTAQDTLSPAPQRGYVRSKGER